jgi:hypothetical protein
MAVVTHPAPEKAIAQKIKFKHAMTGVNEKMRWSSQRCPWIA